MREEIVRKGGAWELCLDFYLENLRFGVWGTCNTCCGHGVWGPRPPAAVGFFHFRGVVCANCDSGDDFESRESRVGWWLVGD